MLLLKKKRDRAVFHEEETYRNNLLEGGNEKWKEKCQIQFHLLYEDL